MANTLKTSLVVFTRKGNMPALLSHYRWRAVAAGWALQSRAAGTRLSLAQLPPASPTVHPPTTPYCPHSPGPTTPSIASPKTSWCSGGEGSLQLPAWQVGCSAVVKPCWWPWHGWPSLALPAPAASPTCA